ncbi:MAG TPA: hypothetical protein VMW17_05585 [Candidatus Binatia bacterium]|nr:hypothetical protein [Candidatus Binatia bacterium]
MPKWHHQALAVLAIALAACGGSVPSVAPLTSAEVLQAGPSTVGVRTVAFIDTSRPTMPNGSYPGSPSRRLTTEIWYPTSASPTQTGQDVRNASVGPGRHPLIIYSHGFMDFRTGGTYLARHLASYGYVVAAPDFPLTRNGAPGGANALDLVNQPGDVRYLIDQFVAMDSDPTSDFAARIDADRIGLSGLSLGGSTTFLATFHPTLRDPRVRAAAPIAGLACQFGPKFYDDRRIPLLIVHGSIDAIVAYPQNAVFAFGEARPPKYLATIAGASHTAFTDGATLFETVPNPDVIGCGALRGPTDDSGTTLSDRLVDLLGGADAGIILGDCPMSCANPNLPRAIRVTRQHELTILSVFPFFEAYLRSDTRAREFLERNAAVENAELTVQFSR